MEACCLCIWWLAWGCSWSEGLGVAKKACCGTRENGYSLEPGATSNQDNLQKVITTTALISSKSFTN